MRVLAVAAMVSVSAGAAWAQVAECPASFGGTDPLVCLCTAGAAGGSVWGSDPYTADSNICAAAIHAGRMTPNGGAIQVFPAAGAESYQGSAANGITTQNWGRYDRSFTFTPPLPVFFGSAEACGTMPSGAERHTCSCAPGAATGSVWGSGPYTNDSGICAAATHAGVIGAQGGTVTVLGLAGLDAYRGSARNGVTTGNWGAFRGSITFDGNAE